MPWLTILGMVISLRLTISHSFMPEISLNGYYSTIIHQRNLSREMMTELLLTAECDVLIGTEPLNVPGLIIN